MPPTDSSNIPPHTELAGFEILGKIADGGMGSVYRARQSSLNRTVALKILAARFTADAKFVESFRRESQAAANLHHPNLISVFDAGEIEGMQYYAMELIEGRTLKDWLAEDGFLAESTALQVAHCVAGALKFGWEKGRLIHRDIKPENIMIDTDGNVKVCDLGLAKTFGENTMLTMSGMVVGTPHFISPEQAHGNPMLDQRSDIYSLGMTLYQMVTGQLPFPAATPAAVMAKHLTEQLSDPREFVPSVSLAMCRLLEKMLVKNPVDRYQTWDDVLADLELVERGQMPAATLLPGTASTLRVSSKFGARSAASPAAPRSSAPLRRPASANSWLPKILGGIAVAGIVVLIVLLWTGKIRFGPTPPPSSPAVKTPPTPPKPPVSTDAMRLLKESLQFAAENKDDPDKLDAILQRFNEIRQRFPNTPQAAEVQQYIAYWSQKKQTLDTQRAMEGDMMAAQQFAKAHPEEFDAIIERFTALAEQFRGQPVAEEARQLAADWKNKKKLANQKKLEDEARRLAAEKKAEENERQRAEREKQEAANRLATEMKFIEIFARPYLNALARRDYAGAAQFVRTAQVDNVFLALNERMTACGEIAKHLETFWGALPQHLETYKGKTVSLGSKRGVFEEVSKGEIALAISVGAVVGIPLTGVSFDDLYSLTASALKPDNGRDWFGLGLFCFAEGKMDKAAAPFETAKKRGVESPPIRAALDYFANTLPSAEEALGVLKELRALIENKQWPLARTKLELLRTKYVTTVVTQASAAELQEMDKKISAFEEQNAEAGAQRMLGDIRAAARARQWKAVADQIERFKKLYGTTKLAETVSAEVEALAQTSLIGQGLMASPDEDNERRQLVQKRGGQIIILRADAPNTPGSQGEKQVKTFSEAISAAKAGDGIEIWDGTYAMGRVERPVNDLLIYGKAGAFPVIQSVDAPLRDPRELTYLFSVGENWRLENLFFVAPPSGENINHAFFRAHKKSLATIRFKGCALAGGGPRMFSEGQQINLIFEDCLLVNFRRLCDYWDVARIKMDHCTAAKFRCFFVFNPDRQKQERSLELTARDCVFYQGHLFLESRPFNERQPFGERDYGVIYEGNRNYFLTRRSSIIADPKDKEVSLEEWRRLTDSDKFSLAADPGEINESFMNISTGDFRLPKNSPGLDLSDDKSPSGVRWPLWKWNLFLEKWPKQKTDQQ